MSARGLKALVLPPASRLEDVCSPVCRALLSDRFDPVWNTTGKDYTAESVRVMIPEAEVVLTSWGSPNLDEATVAKATKLRYVGHAAGSVKQLVPEGIFDRGVRVFSAASRIADAVGEYCLAAVLGCLRNLNQFDRGTREGSWKSSAGLGRELAGLRVGVASASSTARAFIKLLAPFHVDLLIYDPFLSAEAARELGGRKAELEDVMACDVVSLHIPKLPETEGMITSRHLGLIPNGAVFINSSRGSVVNETALVTELEKGRFQAALDVFTVEPLPGDSPLKKMDNVLLSPHIAGHSHQGHQALMETVVRDILAAEAGEPTRFEVKKAVWQRSA